MWSDRTRGTALTCPRMGLDEVLGRFCCEGGEELAQPGQGGWECHIAAEFKVSLDGALNSLIWWPCTQQGVGMKCSVKVSSNTNYSVILWSWILYFVYLALGSGWPLASVFWSLWTVWRSKFHRWHFRKWLFNLGKWTPFREVSCIRFREAV